MFMVKCGNSTIQHIFKNRYFYFVKNRLIYEKSGGFMYLGLAVALATWYNCTGSAKMSGKIY